LEKDGSDGLVEAMRDGEEPTIAPGLEGRDHRPVDDPTPVALSRKLNTTPPAVGSMLILFCQAMFLFNVISVEKSREIRGKLRWLRCCTVAKLLTLR
jgi:hypothetical protein